MSEASPYNDKPTGRRMIMETQTTPTPDEPTSTVPVERIVMPWISIAERLPPLREDVLFCCEIDGEFTRVDLGQYGGEKTYGEAVVMDLSEYDWSPCSHWMPLPDPPSA